METTMGDLKGAVYEGEVGGNDDRVALQGKECNVVHLLDPPNTIHTIVLTVC